MKIHTIKYSTVEHSKAAVTSEAIRIAKQMVRLAIIRRGQRLPNYTQAEISKAAHELLQQSNLIWRRAKRNLQWVEDTVRRET